LHNQIGAVVLEDEMRRQLSGGLFDITHPNEERLQTGIIHDQANSAAENERLAAIVGAFRCAAKRGLFGADSNDILSTTPPPDRLKYKHLF